MHLLLGKFLVPIALALITNDIQWKQIYIFLNKLPIVLHFNISLQSEI